MSAPGRDDELHEALGQSQRLGFLGDRPIPEVIAHARMFVRALEDWTGTVADLGAGGGVPGLVIAHDRPDLVVRLIDRRQKRTDFLQRLCRRYGWLASAEVVCADVDDLVTAIAPGPDGTGATTGTDATTDPATTTGSGARPADVVVARGFGPPLRTVTAAASLVRPGGLIVISEPPEGDRWEPDQLQELGVRRVPTAHPEDRLVTFVRTG